jgi:hypothetical protein
MEIETAQRGKALRVTPASIAASICALLCIAFNASAQDPLLIVRAADSSFIEAARGLTQELGDGWTFKELVVTGETKPEAVDLAMRSFSPKAVILMDNRSIRLYRQFCKNAAVSLPAPSVSLMAVFVEEEIRGLHNAAGISYEIPIVTSVLNIRPACQKEIRKVGIVYRGFMSGDIEKNKVFCEKEGIVLAGRAAAERTFDRSFSLRRNLRWLLEKEKVDALWAPNDNLFLSGALIRDVWQPLIRTHMIPVIVGVKNLAAPAMEFGMFAVTPDHVGLGAQAAELVREARDNGWRFDSTIVQPPISIVKTVNVRQAKAFGVVTEKRVEGMDFILE